VGVIQVTTSLTTLLQAAPLTAAHRHSHEQDHEHDRDRNHDHDDAGVNREHDKGGAHRTSPSWTLPHA
jgi:ABC-type Zn2+ transport system substrate-binding protein/surface adhesin